MYNTYTYNANHQKHRQTHKHTFERYSVDEREIAIKLKLEQDDRLNRRRLEINIYE